MNPIMKWSNNFIILFLLLLKEFKGEQSDFEREPTNIFIFRSSGSDAIEFKSDDRNNRIKERSFALALRKRSDDGCFGSSSKNIDLKNSAVQKKQVPRRLSYSIQSPGKGYYADRDSPPSRRRNRLRKNKKKSRSYRKGSYASSKKNKAKKIRLIDRIKMTEKKMFDAKKRNEQVKEVIKSEQSEQAEHAEQSEHVEKVKQRIGQINIEAPKHKIETSIIATESAVRTLTQEISEPEPEPSQVYDPTVIVNENKGIITGTSGYYNGYTEYSNDDDYYDDNEQQEEEEEENVNHDGGDDGDNCNDSLINIATTTNQNDTVPAEDTPTIPIKIDTKPADKVDSPKPVTVPITKPATDPAPSPSVQKPKSHLPNKSAVAATAVSNTIMTSSCVIPEKQELNYIDVQAAHMKNLKELEGGMQNALFYTAVIVVVIIVVYSVYYIATLRRIYRRKVSDLRRRKRFLRAEVEEQEEDIKDTPV